jgi:hypothetical protein
MLVTTKLITMMILSKQNQLKSVLGEYGLNFLVVLCPASCPQSEAAIFAICPYSSMTFFGVLVRLFS